MSSTPAMANLRRYGPSVLMLLLALAALISGFSHFISLDQLRERREQLEAIVAAHPAISLALYLGLYVVCIALSLPAALVLTLTGGFLFGAVEGGLTAAFGATLGAGVVFAIGRTAARDVLRRRAGPTAARIEAGVRKNAFVYVMSLRLLPVMPFWLVNLAAALVDIPFRVFMAATLVGILPASLIYAMLGSELHGVFRRGEAIEPGMFLRPGVIAPLMAVAALSVAPVVWKRMMEKREHLSHRKREGPGAKRSGG